MHTISDEVSAGRRRRRTHSAEFKAQVVTACSSPGVSSAAVAMAHGVNANIKEPARTVEMACFLRYCLLTAQMGPSSFRVEPNTHNPWS